MGKIDTRVVGVKESRDQIERVLAGCISDDTQRSGGPMHIGAMQEAFRRSRGESGGRIDEGDEGRG